MARKSICEDGKVTKPGRIYLGKVINRDKNIFWNSERGYFAFDPETLTFSEPEKDDIPDSEFRPDYITTPITWQLFSKIH